MNRLQLAVTVDALRIFSTQGVISDQGVRISTKRQNKHHIIFGSVATPPRKKVWMKEALECRKRMQSVKVGPYLWLCWLHPPPEVCTQASVCAAGSPLWNAHHSPGSHLPNRPRRGFLQAPPGDVLRPHPCWASSGDLFVTAPGVERRAGERSLAPRPQGWGCTRSLPHRQHRSPRRGPRSETDWYPLTGRCSPKTRWLPQLKQPQSKQALYRIDILCFWAWKNT